ncbi:5-aminolevulinate synthase, erythroid-specific, mitochondrial-like isoform X1 [Melopsittacus undulatus]|uniref:5-aminolevulinate synthase, erythroid-specific, mitochondrial-like isoform X1 n=2 Tax=Melopsittacus undulatus TaxID=13146 RepID=UPI00146A078A|nr:5-aminolevulinate synthase, erythroid-specific, mitochondrial-like isoform X1 [Melopsittacus undulatus]
MGQVMGQAMGCCPPTLPLPHSTMAALLRCPILARHPWLARALVTAPPQPHPGDTSRGSHCPFMDLGGDPPFVQRAPPEVQEDVTPPETAPLDWLMELMETPKEAPPERALEDNLPDGAFPYTALLESRLAALRSTHAYRVFTAVRRRAEAPPLALGGAPQRPLQLWCSNDYLGMSRHPAVLRAARAALSAHGLGSGGTRNLSGTSPVHEALELSLAQLHQQPQALLFGSCFSANDTGLGTLLRVLPGCEVFSDAGNHASIIQGILRSGAPKRLFRHNDPEHLGELLARSPPGTPKIVAFESVHSMDGSIAPLSELCDVAHAHGALTFVDEVHAVGLYGARGAGIAERDRVLHKVDIVAGTLGKAVGAVGGYLAGPAPLVDAVRSLGAGFIFTTSLPPAVAAGALAALRVLAGAEGRALRRALQRHARYLRELLRDRRLPVRACASHIVPLPVGDALAAQRLTQVLLQHHGLYVQAVNYPTVPRGEELLRLVPTPHHSPAMMENLADRLSQCWEALGLPREAPPGSSCSSCRRPLHWALMSDWERRHFQGEAVPVGA